MKPIERVQELIDAKNLSVSAFERQIGASNAAIQTAIKRNANLKDETLNMILDTFPEVSVVWLLRGIGEMFSGGEEVGAQPPEPRTMEEILVSHFMDKLRPHLNEQKNISINLKKLFLIMDEMRDNLDDVKDDVKGMSDIILSRK